MKARGFESHSQTVASRLYLCMQILARGGIHSHVNLALSLFVISDGDSVADVAVGVPRAGADDDGKVFEFVPLSHRLACSLGLPNPVLL